MEFSVSGFQLGLLVGLPDKESRMKVAEAIIQYSKKTADMVSTWKENALPTDVVELLTEGQKKYIMKLREEGYVPSALNIDSLSKQEASIVIQTALKEKFVLKEKAKTQRVETEEEKDKGEENILLPEEFPDY